MDSDRRVTAVLLALLMVTSMVAMSSPGLGATADATTASVGPETDDTTTARTIIVDDDDSAADFASIQEAVTDAAPGDTVEVRPGTYREEVTIDETITVVAPDGATLNGSTLGNSSVGFTIEGSAAPTVSGFVVTGYGRGVDARGPGVGRPGSTGDWTLRSLTVRNAGFGAVDASGSGGDWTIETSALVDERNDAVDASDTTGDWTVRDSTLTSRLYAFNASGRWTVDGTLVNDSFGEGIVARQTDAAWTIRNATVRDVPFDGISAAHSTGAWTVRGSAVLNISQNGIAASETGGDWTVRDTVIRNSTDQGVDAYRASSDWAILNATIAGNGGTGVDALDTNGSWEIHDSAIVDNEGGGAVAFDADPTGDATRNWWGACDGPSDQFDGSGAPAAGNLVVEPFYVDAARTTLSNETDDPCGSASFDFDVELNEDSETVTEGGDVGISASFTNNADRSISGVTVELLVDGDEDGQFEADEAVAARTTDFGPLELRAIDFEYADVQLSSESGPYRYAARIRKEGNATRSATEGTLTVEAVNRPPVARIAANRTVVSGNGSGVAFDATNASDPDGTVESYAWDFDGGGDPEAFGPEVTTAFASPGENSTTVRVELTVTDDDGASDTARLLVTIAPETNQPPTAAFSQSPFLPAFGANVTLNATASNDADGNVESYAWDLDGDGNADATGAVVTRNASTITANATLTVTDDDGASDAISKPVHTLSLRRNGSGTYTVGDTTTYVNDPPIADFSVSPARPEPADTIRFRSTSVDLDGGLDDLTWYVNGTQARFLDSVFGTVDETLVLASSRGSLSAGSYNVTLVATDIAGESSRATKLITVADRQDDPAVSFQYAGQGSDSPGSIVVGENVRFRADAQVAAGRSVDSIEWSFLGADDIELSGSSVVTSFTSTGTAAFTLTVEDSAGETATVFETIEVEARNEVPKITDVEADKQGSTLEGAPISNTYTASIDNADPIDRVEFELAGRTKTDRSGGNGWSATFDLGRLNGDATLTVTVVDGDGDRDTTTHRVDVVRTPGWVDGLINAGTVSVERSRPKIVVSRKVPDPPIDIDVSPPSGVPLLGGLDVFKLIIRSETELVYVMPARTARIDGDGTFEAALVGNSLDLDVGAEGRIDIDSNENWKLVRLKVVATGNTCCTKKGGSVQAGPISVTASIKYGRTASLTGTLEDRSGTLALAGGGLGLGVIVRDARATAGVSGFPCGVGLVINEGELSGRIKFTTKPFSVTPGITYLADGEVGLIGGVLCPAFSFRAQGTIGANRIGSNSLALQALDAADLEVASTAGLPPARLGTPPAEETDAATTLGIDAQPQSIATGTRLTEDDRNDGPPALAYGNGTYTAVWARQNPGSDAGEFDVTTATSTDAGWTAPSGLNDSERTAFAPDVAADGDRRVAVWTRAPTPTGDTTLDQLLANASLGVAVDDGSGWQTVGPVEDGNESSPVVAVDDGTALLAWIRDRDGNRSTTADREVRWTTYDGSFGRLRTIPNATAVDVAGGADGLTLVYLESDDGANGSVVRADLVSGTLVRSDRHTATRVTDVSAGSRAVTWATATDDGIVLRHAADGPVTTVPTDDVVGVDGVELLDDAGQSVLVYSGLPLNGSGTALYAQRHTPTGWLPPERITAITDGNLSIVGTGAAAGEDELAAVLGLTNASGGYPDVFAARQRFAPDLTVDARTDADLDDTTAGDRVAVNYTVRNVGGRATTTDATVALDTTGGTVATRTHGPLPPGERAAGSVTVRVGTGPTLRVDPNDAIAETNESNNARAVARARPDLTVEGITQRRAGEQVVVTAELHNDGAVAVANATVALRAGNATLTQRRVDVDATGTRSVRLRVRRDAVNRSLTDAVVVDPDDRIPESDERDNVGSLRLLAVDLALSESVATSDAPGGVLAEAFVSNAGPGDATAAVTLAGDGTATDAGLTYDLPIEGASDGRVFERVRLYHPTTEGTLDLAVDPRTGADANGLDNVATATVNASANDTAPVRVTGVGATTANGTLTVTATLRTDADVATGVPVAVRAGETTVAERTAVVPGNDSRTVAVNVSTAATSLTVATPGSQATTDLDVAPDVNGNGAPARDSDGDGRFEDVDGNGEFSIVDVAVLLDRFDRPVVRENAALFDFDDSGVVNIVDVAVLLDLT